MFSVECVLCTHIYTSHTHARLQFFGLRERKVELCKELAQRGFIAMAPDTYGGQATGFVPRAISLVLPAVIQGLWNQHLRAVDSAVAFALVKFWKRHRALAIRP